MERIRSLIWSGEPKEGDLSDALQEEVSKQLPGLDSDIIRDLARRSAANLVVGLTHAKRQAIRKLTERAAIHDWPADVLAERIKAQIGLDTRGVFAVENYRAALVRKGVPRGKARSQANAYARRLRMSRAGTIARTELVRLVSVAKRAQWEEWQDQGFFDRHARRVFHVHKDERLCPTCRPMNNKRAAVGQPYANGSLGPPLHPNCRCHETLERAGSVLAKESLGPRDGDSDGFVFDGTPQMRPALHAPRITLHDDPKLHNRVVYSTELTQPTGAPVRGTVMDPNDLPPRLYHVTTNASAVKDTGYLLARGKGGLQGDDRDQIVSLTVNPDIALNLQTAMKVMARIARRVGPDVPAVFDEDEKRWIGDTERGNRIVAQFKTFAEAEGWQWNPEINEEGFKVQLNSYGFGDWQREFWGARESKTGRKNPLFFGVSVEQWAALDESNIGIVVISAGDVQESGALVTDFDWDKGNGTNLDEVRVYGDVKITTVEKSSRLLGQDFKYVRMTR